MASPPQSDSQAPEINPEEVRAALNSILASEAFGRAERPARFLRHLVEATLRGETHLLKESLLGADVFERRITWDPRLDPVVRQEAARLRKRIARFYESAPAGMLRIEIPVGTYVPVFSKLSASGPQEIGSTAPASSVAVEPPAAGRWLWFGIAAVLLVGLAGLVLWRTRPSMAESTNSIVVLPFANLNPAAADLYFADGLTDEITDELAQMKSLRVVARASAFQFRGKAVNIRDIGQQLHVAYALEGSVERQGNRVKISAHLERASDGSHVWSNTYDRQAGDLFALQSELASAIAMRLKASVEPTTHRRHVASEEAHNLYMQGRYELEQMTPQSVDSAIATLQHAVDRDPEYAAAYYALGLAKWNQSRASMSQVTGSTARKESAVLFRKALALDPDLADAHAGLANYAMQFEWDWAAAEKELRTGSAGEPSVAVESSYAFYLVFRNRFEEAEEHLRRSQELDPLGGVSLANRGLCWNWEGRFEKSREEFLRMAQRSPAVFPERYMVALTHIEEGHPELGLSTLGELRQRTPVSQIFEALAAARHGNRTEAVRLIAPLEAKYPDTPVANQWFALVYGFLGDEPNTVKWLERSADQHEWQALNLAVHPVYASVRKSPAFQRLIKRMGLD
jgi:TolB-like protein